MSADSNDCTGLREQLNDTDVGSMLREHPTRKSNADRRLACKCCWAQQKYLAVKDGLLEHRKELITFHFEQCSELLKVLDNFAVSLLH